jgi:long-chain acyl-CoA synthetase
VTAPQSLNHLFFDAVERFSTKRAALRYKAGGAWQEISHQELARRVQHAAAGFRELGAAPGDRIAILAHNRPEWAVADYASLTGRFVTVPVYPSLPAAQVAHILRDSGAAIAVVEDLEQYRKIAEHKDSLPQLRATVILDPVEDLPEAIAFSHLLRRGAAAEDHYRDSKERALEAGPDDLATIIYTSGTTGEPKGVMLTHGNFCSNIHSALQVLPIGPADSCLSFLPLSHAFERMAGHFAMLHAGATINYAESFDTVASDLWEVRPTIVLAVPRVYEKIYARALSLADQGGALRRRIFFWARRIGRTWAEHRLSGKRLPLSLRLQYIAADRLIFAQLRNRTGGRIRYFVSGGAPLSAEVAWFFFSAGLPVLEGYGLTETSPVVSVNPLEAPKIGTVGKPLPGVEVKIAEDGEILVRGPNVMKGYYNRPEATREAIDRDGFFHTGDIGELDAEGYLKITDRKKDLIVTAGGKNIAPQPIENLVNSSKFVLNAVMVGDRRPYTILLVVPEIRELKKWAAERKLPEMDTAALLQHPDVVAKMEREVMLQLRDVARFEMPKKIVLLEKDFSLEEGELTPTLKVKRRLIEEKYRDLIERAYAE